MIDWIRRTWHVILPSALALMMGLWGLRSAGPWLDERYTIQAVVYGLPNQFWEAPMLPYYAFMWLWTGGGSWADVGWLRAPSVIAAVVTVATVAVTTRRLSSPRAAFVIASILALAPGFSRYSQEARTYALAAAFVTLATYALVVILQGGRRRVWVLYALSLACATPLLPVSLAAIPAHAIIATGFPGWRRHIRDAALACLALVPIALGEVALAARFADIRDWSTPPVLLDYPEFVSMIADSEYTGVGGTVVAVMLVVLAALTPMGVRWLAGLAVVAAAIWIVSYLAGGWWTDRTFMAFAGMLAVAAGLSLARVSWPSAVVLLVVTAAVSAPAHAAIREPGSRGEDVRQIAAIMDAEGQPGDAVLAPVPWSLAWWSVQHLLKGDTRFTSVTAPTPDRYWEIEPEPTCVDYTEWDLVGRGPNLRLCRGA